MPATRWCGIDDDQITARAFVRYREDGDRDFLFNLKRSAAGRTVLDPPAAALLADCGHFHLMGFSLFSFHLIDEVRKAIEIVKANGVMVSFDPNIRKEMLNIAEMRAGLEFMLQYCDTFLPSGPELTIPTEANTEEAAIAELLGLGISCIVVKRAAQGASYYDAGYALNVPGYKVTEADPTGAGDCFGATAAATVVARQPVSPRSILTRAITRSRRPNRQFGVRSCASVNSASLSYESAMASSAR